MGKRDARLGHQSPQIFRAFFDRVNTIVHPKHLAFTQQLSSNGLGCHSIVVRSHVSAYRLSVGRWRVQQRHVANANQTHLQRARYRRCRHGEHVNVGAHHLHRLFVLHTKALFFVDHEQAQVFETNVFLQQAMRADHHVDFARGEARNHALGLAGADET